MENVLAYTLICKKAGREQDFMEFLAWSIFGIQPDWFIKLTKDKV